MHLKRNEPHICCCPVKGEPLITEEFVKHSIANFVLCTIESFHAGYAHHVCSIFAITVDGHQGHNSNSIGVGTGGGLGGL